MQALLWCQNRDGTERKSGREIVVGKLKTASSKRIVPLNETAIQAIIELRNERYFGEDAPLIPDANGNFTRPLNLRKRFYSILDAAWIDKKGLHSLRHTFATKLVTGVRAEDGTVKALTPRQVADLLGHTTSEITEMYYVKRNTDMLMGITNEFELWLMLFWWCTKRIEWIVWYKVNRKQCKMKNRRTEKTVRRSFIYMGKASENAVKQRK